MNRITNALRGFRARSPRIRPEFQVDGAETYNRRDLVVMKRKPSLARTMSSYLEMLEQLIRSAVEAQSGYSVLRCNDGEAYFLRGEFHGNILRRHLTQSENSVDLALWRRHLHHHDLPTYHLDPDLRGLWKPILGDSYDRPFFPLHAVYALVATRRIFQIVPGARIGLIGPEKKLRLVAALLEREEYRDYLGLAGFHSYVSVPETGASNRPERLAEDLRQRIEREPCDLFLYGMGIAKIVVVSQLRESTSATYVDIGCGLDALAGIVPLDREYFGGWQNYRLAGSDLDGMDLLTPKRSEREMSRFPVQEVITL